MLDAGGGGGGGHQLPSVSDKSEIDVDALKSIIKKLQTNLDKLNPDDSGATEIDRTAFGGDDFVAGQGVAQTAQQAYTAVTSSYGPFITAYQGLVDAIQRAVDNHEQGQQAMASNIERQGSSTGGAPSTGGTSEW